MHNVLLRIGGGLTVAILAAIVTSGWAIVAQADTAAAPGDDGQAIFEQRCQGCHSIGQGRRAGPDLQGITSKREKEWLIATITTPDRLVAQGDATARQLVLEYGMQMPNIGISPKDAEAVIEYLAKSGEQKAASSGANPPAAAAKATQPASEAGNAIVGRQLFIGETAFTNGGAACVSCHNLGSLEPPGGGTLAKDLSQSYTDLGFQGVQSIVANPPFAPMKIAFGTQQLADGEVADVVAFLRQESAHKDRQGDRSATSFAIIGLIGCIISLGLIQLAWPRRLRGIRQALLGGRWK